MMSSFGVLSSFDHNSQSWQTYKQRLNQWFIANDVDKDVKKRAILLSSLSDGTYKLAADLVLPKEIQTVAYDEILQTLDRHFIPKTSGFGERYKFYATVQNAGESFAQWAARLRGLTAQCKFTDVEEALRDRFLMGMWPGPEREKLFTQDLDKLTLAKAVEVADSVSNARAVARAAGGQQDQQLFKITKESKSASSASVKKGQCSVCGYSNHDSAECRFAKYKCKKCNIKGHLRRMCKKINFVDQDLVTEDDDDGKLHNIRTLKGEPMTEIVSVQGKRMKFQIDSGSAVTAMSEQTYKKYFCNVPLSLPNKMLLSYTGESMECVGTAELKFNYSEITQTLKVFIIRNGGPPLLGRDFISKFKLGITPLNFVEQTCSIDQLQAKFPAVFSTELGKFNKYQVNLRLKDNAKPVFIKARPVAYALKEKIGAEIERLVRVGILEPVEHSDYASPVVPVLKRNGSVRLCADYSVTINKQLIVDQYPLPTAQELFTKLHGGEHFSKLDLSQAYSQFELNKESQYLTCINTFKGLFKYTRLVFGLASAPAIFQRAMECLLSGIEGVMCLLDDILVTGADRTQHLQRLNTVLERLQDAGLTLQTEKCEFFKSELQYLGYVINKQGLQKSPEKIAAIINAPVPENVNKLQSFLGLVNYYRNFVPNTSSVLSPLYDLLQKRSQWQWGDKEHEAFNTVKRCIASDQILAHFNPNAKLILTVDASPTGLGAVLSQVDTDGIERPISFASRTLTKAEKRYAQIQKEATAIIFGVRRFHQYLYGRSVPFILRTDHKPLLSIFGPYRGIPEVSANRLQRYAMFLCAYNYTIEYIRSTENSADYLSRSGTTEDECHGFGDSEFIEDRASYVNFVIDNSLPITYDELCKETSKDDTLLKVKKYIYQGWPKKVTCDLIKPYFLVRAQLAVENGCFMRGHKIIIPPSLVERALGELHKSHLGIVKTKAEVRSRFWFPGVDAAVERMISDCAICIQLRQSPARAPLAAWPYPAKPFYRIHIDMLGPLNSNTYLVIVDAHSKWVEAYNMKCNSTSAAIIVKIQGFISRFGLPHTIVSDNGTAFVSQEFGSFCKANGIAHVTSPTYHPASNGQAESFVKIVKKGIKTSVLSSSNQKESNARLLKYLFDYRNSVNTTTGLSPAQLVFGRKLRSRLDLFSSAAPPSSSPEVTSEHVRQKQFLQSNAYKGKNTQNYDAGDYILYKKHANMFLNNRA